MSPQNWDNEFDFQDSPPKAKNVLQKQKQNTDDDDFFNDNSNKLPVLNYKNTPKHVNETKKATANKNDDIYDDDNIQDQVQSLPKNKNQPEEQVHFQEDIDYDAPKKEYKKQSLKAHPKQEIKAKPQQQLKVQNQSQQLEDNYEQQNFQQDYGQDFEEVEAEEPPKKAPNKIALTQQQPRQITQVSSLKKVFNPPKPPSRASQDSKKVAQRGRNLTVDKNLVRNNSRNSLKSVQSRKGIRNSRAASNKLSTNASFVGNKYTSQIDKTFPDVNLSEANQDKVDKLNQKLRAMIKKFNQQLNELINKNMLYLKSNKNHKSKTDDNKLRVLEQQCKNNEAMIEIMTKEFDKLSGRNGELREEEYQLLTQKRIQQIKEHIKESQKSIIKLKNQTKSQGNKLTNKNDDKKLAADMHHLKTTLIQSKKDEQKQNSKIEKLDEQLLSLGQKVSDIQYKISELVDLAKDKGIQLDNKEDANKKFEVLRKKVEASKNHKSKLQNLLKTKSDIVSHQKQQLRISIKNCELQIKNLYDSISHSHNESVKVVQKAKTNPKINQSLLSDLDAILKSLELILHDNHSVRSEQNKSQHSNRPLKNSAIGNMESSDPHKRSQSVNDKHSYGNLGEDHSKPNLLKKKMKINELYEEGKNEVQRIWKDEEKEKKQKQQKTKQPQKAIIEDKKKPFTLKKNRVGGETKMTEQKSLQEIASEGLKLQIEIKRNEEQKKQQVSLAGPRMMKFKRRTNQPKDQQKQEQDKDKPAQLKLVIEQKPKLIDEQQPVFAPKRFNLRNRMEKKEQSYVPTIQKQVQKEVIVEQKKQQYKPKFNFGEVDDPYKRKDPAQIDKKLAEKITIPGLEDEDKPKLNLRLRDRKKNTEQIGYAPSGVVEIKQQQRINLVQQKPSQTKNPYAPSTNNQYVPKQPLANPYAPKHNANTTKNNQYAPKEPTHQNLVQQKNNPSAPREQSLPNNPNNPYIQNQGEGRRKQGPVKKPKAELVAPKQKINIFEQAQEVDGLNQFVNQAPKREPEYTYKPEVSNDLNLNDLLGVKKNNKNNDDLTDLLGGANNNKKVKKNNDFFGDMDL